MSRSAIDHIGSFQEANKLLRVVLAGAYGSVGVAVTSRLIGDTRFAPVLSRHKTSLKTLRGDMAHASVIAAELDVSSAGLPGALARLEPQLVIHVVGSFQGKDYRVDEACLACGSGYIDIVDGRDFVSGIEHLESRAKQRVRLLVSGASTVPALGSALVDALRPRFVRCIALSTPSVPSIGLRAAMRRWHRF